MPDFPSLLQLVVTQPEEMGEVEVLDRVSHLRRLLAMSYTGLVRQSCRDVQTSSPPKLLTGSEMGVKCLRMDGQSQVLRLTLSPQRFSVQEEMAPEFSPSKVVGTYLAMISHLVRLDCKSNVSPVFRAFVRSSLVRIR